MLIGIETVHELSKALCLSIGLGKYVLGPSHIFSSRWRPRPFAYDLGPYSVRLTLFLSLGPQYKFDLLSAGSWTVAESDLLSVSELSHVC